MIPTANLKDDRRPVRILAAIDVVLRLADRKNPIVETEQGA
jgi:hypothetical protein